MLGSFTNVLVARVPAGRDWVRGSSECPHCESQIRWYDNVPLVSWVVLRGKCRDCGGRISVQYPAVELLVAALVLAAAWRFGLSATLAMLTYLAVVTGALAFIDAQKRRLPHSIVLPSLAVVFVTVLIADLAFGEGSWARSLAGAGILGGVYGLLWFVYPQGMGFGDVTTACLMGLALGFLGWDSLAVGGIAGPVIAGFAVLVGFAARRVSKGQLIPYGPFLIAGAWLGVLGGSAIADRYLHMVGLAGGG